MTRLQSMCSTVAALVILSCGLSAQRTKPVDTTMATCNFEDGKQISVRYPLGVTAKADKLPMKELWAPGGSPLVLFTQTDLTVADAVVPAGAYFLYVVPDKEKWTLVVNKNVTANAPYNQQQDLVRVPMELGSFSEPEPFSVILGHVAPKQCNMRIYFGKTGSWVEFREK